MFNRYIYNLTAKFMRINSGDLHVEERRTIIPEGLVEFDFSIFSNIYITHLEYDGAISFIQMNMRGNCVCMCIKNIYRFSLYIYIYYGRII